MPSSLFPEPPNINKTQRYARKGISAFSRLTELEAVSGIILLVAATVALVWANSPFADSYHHLWHTPIALHIGDWHYNESLHFLINDGLMTLFFLVVGMDIRHEIHNGALSKLSAAMLPIIAAVGGILVPAIIYLSVNGAEPVLRQGWAVPTATDIAFAVGVLALLGKGLPPAIRVLLLALAILDDIAAVLIIAIFYSDGLNPAGLLPIAVGIIMVAAMRKMAIVRPLLYAIPGVLVWYGLLKTGAHPTLAGVVLGMLTPVHASAPREYVLESARTAIDVFNQHSEDISKSVARASLYQLDRSRRDLLPPVLQVQMAINPWVSFLIMPLFALANAGVSLGDLSLSHQQTAMVFWGTAAALIIGKPVGVLLASALALRLKICTLPEGLDYKALLLIGLLAGIGFTMAIFVANLAFDNEELLSAAKLGVVSASGLAAATGLAFGFWLKKRIVTQPAKAA